MYHAQGRYKEAERLLQRSLAIYEETVGTDHPNTSISLRQMACLRLDLGCLAQAEVAITRAQEIQKRVRTPEHPRHAETLDVVALLPRENLLRP